MSEATECSWCSGTGGDIHPDPETGEPGHCRHCDGTGKATNPKKDKSMSEKDITCEEWREYDLPGRTTAYRINRPKLLITREGGSCHRVLDAEGVVHCLPAPGNSGCVLRWKSINATKPVNF